MASQFEIVPEAGNRLDLLFQAAVSGNFVEEFDSFDSFQASQAFSEFHRFAVSAEGLTL